jgi:hypothetical protein
MVEAGGEKDRLLKRRLAEQALDIDMLREVSWGNA